ASALEKGETATVREVVDGDTVVLADGRQVRLTGIQAPKLPLGRAGFSKWPLAGEAKAALGGLVLGKEVELRYGGRRMDRHGRVLAHLFTLGGGVWVQGSMLGLGLARVYTFADNRRMAAEMYALERGAREDKLGIWGRSFYGVRVPEEMARDIDTFQVVEGTVLDAALVRGRIYLNFGADWRTDFTVTISPRAGKLFRKSGSDPLSLKGRRIRVRGWIKSYNGPMIEASHPEQIEILSP
ncbi:MAG: thermonuclease family protein, partial [Rhodospirillales bacterium]